jgi:peroxiredoxin
MKKALLSIFIGFFSISLLVAQTDPTTLIKIGDKAPLFTCKTIDNKTVDIANLRGKIILINFFATWCGPCNQELPLLQKNIWDKYKDNPAFELIILGREHTEKEVTDFVISKKYTMPFAPDPKRDIFKLYATQSIPRNIIIGKDGRIIFQSIGYSDSEFKKLEAFITEVLK